MSTIQQQIIEAAQSVSVPGLKPISNPFVSVLQIDTTNDFIIATILVGLFYFAQYFIIGGLLWWTNPIPKTEERNKNTRLQMWYGVTSLLCLILYTTIWLWLVDPHLPYYGYWRDRYNEFGVKELIFQTFFYLFVFDTWFYATHHFLHIKWFMDHVHRHHHQFMEPSALAQDAVHPFESILQGPMGHFLCTLLYPMNPLLISVLGTLSGIYALLAHDGRKLDLNDHVKHHFYRNCNYGLYWGFWDYVFGTRYSRQKYPQKYVPSWEIEALEAKDNSIRTEDKND